MTARLIIGHHVATWSGSELPLTASEFEIFRALALTPGVVVTFARLYAATRNGHLLYVGDGEAGRRTNVRTYIKRIREKLPPDLRKAITSRSSVGYQLNFSDLRIDAPRVDLPERPLDALAEGLLSLVADAEALLSRVRALSDAVTRRINLERNPDDQV